MTAPDLVASFARVHVPAPGQATGPKELTCLTCSLLALPWDMNSWSESRVVNEADVEHPRIVGGSEWWVCLLCERLFHVEWSVPE